MEDTKEGGGGRVGKKMNRVNDSKRAGRAVRGTAGSRGGEGGLVTTCQAVIVLQHSDSRDTQTQQQSLTGNEPVLTAEISVSNRVLRSMVTQYSIQYSGPGPFWPNRSDLF